jgi:hypothetical protein
MTGRRTRREEVIASLAARDPRVRTIRVSDLPEGWLGKVHALDVGTRNTSGDWILYTDADVHFERTALRKAVAVAAEKEADHMTLIPSVRARTFWLKVLIQTFAMSLVAGRNAARIGKRGSRAFWLETKVSAPDSPLPCSSRSAQVAVGRDPAPLIPALPAARGRDLAEHFLPAGATASRPANEVNDKIDHGDHA